MSKSDGTWRIGLVAYMNVQPLVWAFDHCKVAPITDDGVPLTFISAVPSELARNLRDGLCDAGIVPVLEYLRNPRYTIVRAGAIATQMSVGSVLVVARSPLEELRSIALDAASLTSANLLRILHAEYGWKCELREENFSHPCAEGENVPGIESDAEGWLLIGDPALRAASRFPYVYDLARLWYDLTGFPFVFAAWLVHPRAHDAKLHGVLERAREAGIANLEQVARDVAPRFGFAPEFALRYFRENLSFELGDKEIRGLETFAQLAAKHKLIPYAPPLRFHDK